MSEVDERFRRELREGVQRVEQERAARARSRGSERSSLASGREELDWVTFITIGLGVGICIGYASWAGVQMLAKMFETLS